MILDKRLEKSNKALTRYSKSAIVFIICTFLQKAVSMITIPVFTRLLSTSEYGEFNVFTSWLDIVSVFATLRLYLGVFPQGLVKFEKDRKEFVASIRCLNICMLLFWFLCAMVLHRVTDKLLGFSELKILLMFLLIWTTSEIEFWYAQKRVESNYKAVFSFTLLLILLKPIVSILFVVISDDKATARIMGNASVELFCCMILFVIGLVNRNSLFSTKYWKYGVSYNILLIPHYLSQTVLSSSDRLMINSIIGEDAAGVYSLSYSISVIMLVLNQAFMTFLSPWLYQRIKENDIKSIGKKATASILIVAIANTMLIAFAPEVIAIFSPKTYHEAVYIMPPIIMSVYFLYCYEILVRFEFYYEKTFNIMLTSVLCAVINILLNFLFIKRYGYYAAAYTTLFSYILYVVSHGILIFKINRNIIDSLDIKKIVSITIGFMALGGIILVSYYIFYLRAGIVIALILLAAIKKDELKKELEIVLGNEYM